MSTRSCLERVSTAVPIVPMLPGMGDPAAGPSTSAVSPRPRWRPRHRTRVAVVATVDAGAWLVGILLATWLRFALEGDGFADLHVFEMAALAAVVAALVHLVLLVNRGRHTVGSYGDLLDLGRATAVAAAIVFVLNLALPALLVPRSVPVTAALVALVLAASARLVVRRVVERRTRPDRTSARRAVVLGAGIGGQQLIRSMLSDPASGYLPVALLDDDLDVRHRRVLGLRVLGGRHDVAEVAARTGADTVIIAVRDLPGTAMHQVLADATGAGLTVKVLPPLSELFRSWVGFSDLRDLDITDLLRRAPVRTDLAAASQAVTGRRVLVTGAGGSIGSELCRQIHALGPDELMMLDRDESALHAVQLSIHGRALLDSSDVILADIRDPAALESIFTDRRPEVVFHAAALKHLPMLEQYPEEAWKTNVVGTQVVLEAARAVGVATFVNISTDKAANPSSVLGRTKRLGERLVADAALADGLPYLSVRFGNVLASRGSVLTTFAEQLAAGGPITVTHPDVTRYFMTIPEAVQLVVHASVIGRAGEALVLDMGEPVRILDVAHQLMEIAGQGIDIVYTGLREGEKLHEELFGDGEIGQRPFHPLISHVDVPPLSFARARLHATRVGVSPALVDLVDDVVAPNWLDILADEPLAVPENAQAGR